MRFVFSVGVHPEEEASVVTAYRVASLLRERGHEVKTRPFPPKCTPIEILTELSKDEKHRVKWKLKLSEKLERLDAEEKKQFVTLPGNDAHVIQFHNGPCDAFPLTSPKRVCEGSLKFTPPRRFPVDATLWIMLRPESKNGYLKGQLELPAKAKSMPKKKASIIKNAARKLIRMRSKLKKYRRILDHIEYGEADGEYFPFDSKYHDKKFIIHVADELENAAETEEIYAQAHPEEIENRHRLLKGTSETETENDIQTALFSRYIKLTSKQLRQQISKRKKEFTKLIQAEGKKHGSKSATKLRNKIKELEEELATRIESEKKARKLGTTIEKLALKYRYFPS